MPRPILLLAFLAGCSCRDGNSSTIPGAGRDLLLTEHFEVSGINASQHEHHRLGLDRRETLLREATPVTEVLPLGQKLDLIVVLDDSSSMADVKAAFIDESAGLFLDRVTADVPGADVQVRFLGAGPGGHQAFLPFTWYADSAIFDDILEKDPFTHLYSFPAIRAHIAAREGLADDDALDDFVQEVGWLDPYIVPPILADASFYAEFGDDETLVEWFRLYTLNTVANPYQAGTPQGSLALNTLRYFAEAASLAEDWPRGDASVAVIWITDDIEDYAADTEAPLEDALFWNASYVAGCSDWEARGFVDARRCAIEDYADDWVASALGILGHDDLTVFSMTCVETDAQSNSGCARSGAQGRPPYAAIATRTGGRHVEMPTDAVGYEGALDDFGEQLHDATRHRFAVADAPMPATVLVSLDGTPVPLATRAGDRGWACVSDDCRVMRLVGYNAVADDATVEVTYLPRTAVEAATIARVPLSETAEPDSVRVFHAGDLLPDAAWSLEGNSVVLAEPSMGAVLVTYRVPEDVPTLLVETRELPRPDTMQVILAEGLLAECPDEDAVGCWRSRPERGVEIVREEVDGALWPAVDARLELIYQAEDRVRPDEPTRSARFRLARTPTSAADIAVDAVVGGQPLALHPSLWTWDGTENAVFLDAEAGSSFRVRYDVTGLEPIASRTWTPELAALLDTVEATPAFHALCLGEGIEGRGDLMVVLRDETDARIAGASLGPLQQAPWGPAWTVSGVSDREPFTLYEAQADASCSDADNIANRLHGLAVSSLITHRRYAAALCPTVAAARRCPERNHLANAAFLLNEIGRHAEDLLPSGGEALGTSSLTAAETVLTGLLADDPGDVNAMANLAFSNWQLAERGEGDPTVRMATARLLLEDMALQGGSGVLWDVHATYLDAIFADVEAGWEAQYRGAFLAHWMLTPRGGPAGMAARGRNQGAGPSGPGYGGLFQNAFSAGWSLGDQLSVCRPLICIPFECELEIRFAAGILPPAAVGIAVQDAAEYAICELILGECTCEETPDEPNACFRPIFLPALEVFGNLLGLSSAANPVGLGATFNGDGTVDYDLSVGIGPDSPYLDGAGLGLNAKGTVGICDDGGGDINLHQISLGAGGPFEVGIVAVAPEDGSATAESTPPRGGPSDLPSGWSRAFNLPGLEDGGPTCEERPKPPICED